MAYKILNSFHIVFFYFFFVTFLSFFLHFASHFGNEFLRWRKLGYVTSWLGASAGTTDTFCTMNYDVDQNGAERVPFSAAIIYCLSVYSKHLSPFRSYSQRLAIIHIGHSFVAILPLV